MDGTVAFRLLLLVPLGLDLLFDAGQDPLDTTEQSVIRGVSEGQEKLDTAHRPFEGARRGCLRTLPDALRRFLSGFLADTAITLRGLIQPLQLLPISILTLPLSQSPAHSMGLFC
jgi:hypothetical protein